MKMTKGKVEKFSNTSIKTYLISSIIILVKNLVREGEDL
jgi:hypothetical protein